MPDPQSSVNSPTFKLSSFGKKLGESTGIGELMDDLGAALVDKSKDLAMLGGGQPAYIPEMVALFHKRLLELGANSEHLHGILGEYDPAEGNLSFRHSFADMMNDLYGWGITAQHVGIAAGGQSACFHLMNALVGEGEQVLIPLLPDYMGYRDQLVSGAEFLGIEGVIQRKGSRFKYSIDQEAVSAAPDTVKMMTVSRPTNPSGNVLTDDEMGFLSEECRQRDCLLLVDHAYGEPAPGAVYVQTQSEWEKHHIHLYSLSKLGLPGSRTAIVVAHPTLIKLLGNMTAVTSLANPNLGQALIHPLLVDRSLVRLSETIIQPFYKKKRDHALSCLDGLLGESVNYAVHEPEGAFFLWLWFPDLGIDSRELVERLKEKGVLTISGHWFFFGCKASLHSQKCLRITYSMDEKEVERGIRIMVDTILNDKIGGQNVIVQNTTC